MEFDTASFEDVAVVRNFESEIGVLFDEEDGDAVLAIDLNDFFEDRFD